MEVNTLLILALESSSELGTVLVGGIGASEDFIFHLKTVKAHNGKRGFKVVRIFDVASPPPFVSAFHVKLFGDSD